MKKEGNRWIFEEADNEYLRIHYPDGTICDIADHLGVSPPIVRKQVDLLGLKHSSSWSKLNFRNRYIKNYSGYSLFLLLFLLSGCKTVYVPIETVRTEYYTHTDSIRQIDTIFREKETVIREADRTADSLLLSKYGIRLRDNERLLLFLQNELSKEKELKHDIRVDTLIRVDSIRVPYPIEKRVPVWEKVKSYCVGIFAGVCLASAVALSLWLRRRYKRC